MPGVLFVCTANICRSPVAEALFADWLAKQGLPGDWEVTSAGTWAQPGLPASTYSRDVLAALGLDLSRHHARRVDREMLEKADVVLCMTRSQAEALQAEFPPLASRIRLLAEMAGSGYDISDPYGGPRRGYEDMAAELQHLVELGGARIVALAREPARPARAAGQT